MVLKVFIGWDPGQDLAYRVTRASLLKRATIPVEVRPLVLADLQREGAYRRPVDPLAATESTYTRFLTPFLAGEGMALYCDGDFLWLDDVAALIDRLDRSKPLHVVKHDHRPTEVRKMGGRAQTTYPRKNWSSLMVFDAGHPAVRVLTPEAVNRLTAAQLHRMAWIDDHRIGGLDPRWNWLEGWSPPPAEGVPGAVHFTRGGPWLEAYRSVAYADLWRAEAAGLARPLRAVS